MANPITVCHVLHSLNVGGAEVLAYRLATQLQNSELRFVFACLDEAGDMAQELERQGVSVAVLNRRAGFDWGCAVRLSRFLRDSQVSVVHAHQYAPFFYAAVGRLWRSRPRILFTEHGRSHPDFRRPKRVIFNRIMLARTDRVVGVGEAVREALTQNEGLSGENVDVVYNGVAPSEAVKRGATRGDVVAEFGLAPDVELIVQVARLDPLKNHETALRAVAKLLVKRPAARLLIVGEGPERPLIERTIEELKIRDHVVLAGLRSDVPRLLGAANVFLLTSVSEGIPVTQIEAMLAGLPVVSTDVGGVAEVVIDGETGLLRGAKDADGIAAALERVLEEPAYGEQLGKAGRSRAEAMFTEEAMHARYAELYRELAR